MRVQVLSRSYTEFAVQDVCTPPVQGVAEATPSSDGTRRLGSSTDRGHSLVASRSGSRSQSTRRCPRASCLARDAGRHASCSSFIFSLVILGKLHLQIIGHATLLLVRPAMHATPEGMRPVHQYSVVLRLTVHRARDAALSASCLARDA